MNHCASLWFCAALVSDAPAGFCAEEWGKWGLAGLVVAYTLWRDWEREKRMADTIKMHDIWVKEQMLTAIRESAAAAARRKDD